MLILKAKEHKWGLIGPGDWETRSWKINDDGWYQYKESYLKTKTGVRPNTLSNYNFVRNLLAGEDFSDKTIGSVKTSDAKLFLIKLQDDGKEYSTIKTVRGVLRPALKINFHFFETTAITVL